MTQDILFTAQKHQADRAGLHTDYRLVIGDVGYSWATKKDLPEEGKSIILWQQPPHSRDYSLSSHIIPAGQYGAGLQELQYAKKAKLHSDSTADKIKFTTTTGESFMIKKMPENYGKGAWLFKRIPSENKYLTKAAALLGLEKLALLPVSNPISPPTGTQLNPGEQGFIDKLKANPTQLSQVAQAIKKLPPSPGITKLANITKFSTLIQQYECKETGEKIWHKEGSPKPGEGWVPVKGHIKYIKKVAEILKKAASPASSLVEETSNKLCSQTEKQEHGRTGSFFDHALWAESGVRGE